MTLALSPALTAGAARGRTGAVAVDETVAVLPVVAVRLADNDNLDDAEGYTDAVCVDE
jgi:hypothetical protein